MFRKKRGADHEQKKRVQKTLKVLKRNEQKLKAKVEECQRSLVEMHKALKKTQEQYDIALEEARSAISKYERTVDELRDTVLINERTMRVQDAAFQNLHETYVANTVLNIAKKTEADNGRY